MGPGAAVVGRWSLLGPSQVRPCEVVPRPVPGGDPGFLEKARTQRVGGCPPPPLSLWPARFHSLVLAWWGARGGGEAITVPICVP